MIDREIAPRFAICPFPKHEGKRWEDVIAEDRQYVEWLVSGSGPNMSVFLYEHLIELLEESGDG